MDKDLKQEIATAAKDFLNQSFFGMMLGAADDTLDSRGGDKGLKLYDEIERDCHAYAVLQKRKMAVIAREYVVDAASDSRIDRKAADLVRAALKDMSFDQACYDLLDAILKGFAVGEVMWRQAGDLILPYEIRPRDQRRFLFDAERQPRLKTLSNHLPGEEIPERRMIIHRFGAKDGNPYGLGLGTRLFWPVFFKRQGVTFWLTFADKFGSPTSVGIYPPGTDEAGQKKLLGALAALANDTGVIIPQGMEIKLLEAASGGKISTHEGLCRYMDEQISEAVLGETLTTNIGNKGSLAAGQVHNEVREELTKADADLLSGTLNDSLIRWIVELNMPAATSPRLWRSFEEPEDLTARVNRDKVIFDLGFRPTINYIRETYGEGWELKEEKKPEDRNQDQQEGRIGAEVPAAQFAEEPIEKDNIDDLADQLDQLASGEMAAMIDRIRALVEQAESMEEIADKLVELYPEIKADGLAQLLGQAMITAEQTGRSEIINGPA